MKKLLYILLIALCLVSCSDKVSEGTDPNIHAQYFEGGFQTVGGQSLFLVNLKGGISEDLPNPLIVPQYLGSTKVDGLKQSAFKIYVVEKVYVPDTLSHIENFVLLFSNVGEMEVPEELDTFEHYYTVVTKY